MVKNQEFTIADYVAKKLNEDVKRRAEFLGTSPNEYAIAVREAVSWAMSKTGVGEGNIPIATTKKGFIVAAFFDPQVRDGSASQPIVSPKQTYESVFHSSMATRAWCADISRVLPYEVLRKYLVGLETELPGGIETYVRNTFNSSMNNINKSFKRERYNLILSLKEYPALPAKLDDDSMAGLNLTVVSEMMTRMVISEEDVKGNKKYLKRSQLEANPLISLAIRDLIYKMAKEAIEEERKEDTEEE